MHSHIDWGGWQLNHQLSILTKTEHVHCPWASFGKHHLLHWEIPPCVVHWLLFYSSESFLFYPVCRPPPQSWCQSLDKSSQTVIRKMTRLDGLVTQEWWHKVIVLYANTPWTWIKSSFTIDLNRILSSQYQDLRDVYALKFGDNLQSHILTLIHSGSGWRAIRELVGLYVLLINAFRVCDML